MRNPLISTTVIVALLSSIGLFTDSAQASPKASTLIAQSNRSEQSPYIDSFTAQPVESLEPGTELVFTLEGTPQARATFSIEGVVLNQRMREVSSGLYEGRYVIRRQDVVPTDKVNVIATLRSGNELIRARLNQDLATGNGSSNTTTQLPLEITSPQNNSKVNGTVEVSGRSAPNATVNVKVRAVNSLAGVIGLNRDVFSQGIKTDNQGNFNFSFQSGVTVPGTRYEVSLSAIKGNQTAEESLVLVQQ